MPNHCTNEVTLTCPSREIALRMKELLAGKETQFDFNRLAPEPEALLEQTDDVREQAERIAEHGYHWWYDWRIANWGTKWNSYDCSLDDSGIEDGILEYRFDTAWGPPEGIHRKLLGYIETHRLDIGVSWFYREPNMELAGYLGEEG